MSDVKPDPVQVTLGALKTTAEEGVQVTLGALKTSVHGLMTLFSNKRGLNRDECSTPPASPEKKAVKKAEQDAFDAAWKKPFSVDGVVETPSKPPAADAVDEEQQQFNSFNFWKIQPIAEPDDDAAEFSDYNFWKPPMPTLSELEATDPPSVGADALRDEANEGQRAAAYEWASDLLANKQERIKYAKKLFGEVDIDGGGTIDTDEALKLVQRIAAEMGLPLPPDDRVKTLLDLCDKSGDGQLQVGEFLSFFKAILDSAVKHM